MKQLNNFTQAMLTATLVLAGCTNQPLTSGNPDEPGAESATASSAQGLDPRILIGFNIAPVPLNLAGKNHALVGLGSYLVNAQAGCNDCHTSPSWAPGHNPFLGQPKEVNTAVYLAGGASFGNDVVSANLTPDPSTGLPAQLTYKQFKSALQTGQDPNDGTRILQVMPWPIYQSMLEQELQAIYAYLSAIPSACAPAPNDCYP